MRIKTSRLSVFLTLIIVTRSLVPVGYMLDVGSDSETDGSSYLSFCPLQNPSLNFGELNGDEVAHHINHYVVDDLSGGLPPDAYYPTVGLQDCVLWQLAEAFADLLPLSGEANPIKGLFTNDIPVFFLPTIKYFSNAPRAPPSSLSLDNFLS